MKFMTAKEFLETDFGPLPRRYDAVHDDAMVRETEGDWVPFDNVTEIIRWHRARIAELEAKQEKLIGWLVEASQNPNNSIGCEAAIRKALESPEPLA
jgi:hypothetical protein